MIYSTIELWDTITAITNQDLNGFLEHLMQPPRQKKIFAIAYAKFSNPQHFLPNLFHYFVPFHSLHPLLSSYVSLLKPKLSPLLYLAIVNKLRVPKHFLGWDLQAKVNVYHQHRLSHIPTLVRFTPRSLHMTFSISRNAFVTVNVTGVAHNYREGRRCSCRWHACVQLLLMVQVGPKMGPHLRQTQLICLRDLYTIGVVVQLILLLIGTRGSRRICSGRRIGR
jgi:hypothetical protein